MDGLTIYQVLDQIMEARMADPDEWTDLRLMAGTLSEPFETGSLFGLPFRVQKISAGSTLFGVRVV